MNIVYSHPLKSGPPFYVANRFISLFGQIRNNSNAVNPTCPFRVIETVLETVMETVRKIANLIGLHWVIPYQALLCLLFIFDVTEARRVARVLGNLHAEDR